MTQLSQQRTAVITGSTSGIGLAIAHALARAGANIVMNGLGGERDNAEAIAEVRAVAEAHGGKVAFDPADLLQPDQITAMIAAAERDFGAVDILVNNAGIQHVAPVDEFPVERWNAIIAIILTAAFHTVRAAVPGMKKRRWGRIINTCSAHSMRASPYKTAYIAAKHGLAGFTKAVAIELAPDGITSNAVSPGFVWTPLVAKQIPDLAKSGGISEDEAKRKLLTRQPTGRFVTVDEVAALVAFLACEAAGSITGANYSIDGGWTAQ